MLIKKMQEFLYPKLAKIHFSSNNEMYLYIILHVALLFTSVMHTVLFSIFFIAGVWPMVCLNAFSLLVYTFGYFLLLRKRQYFSAGILVCLEVFIYSLISIYFIGDTNYTTLYFFVMLIMQVIIPYAKAKVRIGMAALFWCGTMLAIALDFYQTPLPEWKTMNLVLAVFNINLAAFGVMAELLVGNIIRRFINSYNKKQMGELMEQAYSDSLTGLYNRRYADIFFEKLKGEPETGYFVAFLDIDNFKEINDVHGHNVGDQVLIALAEILKKTLRKSDTIFRWGGEEFLIVLKEVDEPTTVMVLETLREKIAETVVQEGKENVHFTVSIGAVQLDLRDIEKSIEESDKKLYESKRGGKNKVVV